MIYKKQKVKPQIGDLCRWKDEIDEFHGFVTDVWKDHISFHFRDGSKKTLTKSGCRNFQIVANNAGRI